jgi:hypothetical protein
MSSSLVPGLGESPQIGFARPICSGAPRRLGILVRVAETVTIHPDCYFPELASDRVASYGRRPQSKAAPSRRAHANQGDLTTRKHDASTWLPTTLRGSVEDVALDRTEAQRQYLRGRCPDCMSGREDDLPGNPDHPRADRSRQSDPRYDLRACPTEQGAAAEGSSRAIAHADLNRSHQGSFLRRRLPKLQRCDRRLFSVPQIAHLRKPYVSSAQPSHSSLAQCR